jgi:hypothetical protein
LTPKSLTGASLALVVSAAMLATYWLALSPAPGLPLPRQVLLGLLFGAGFFLYGCGVARRRDRLVRDGRVDHGFVTKLIYQSVAFATAVMAVTLPSLYLLVAYAVEGSLVSAPEIEARLPVGYSVNFVLGLAALGGVVSTAYTAIGYLDHVNAG